MKNDVFERLMEEFQMLNDKVMKLRTFIMDADKFNQLDNLNRDLLVAQLKAMEAYLSVLSIRIGLNSPQTEQPEEAEIISE